MARLMHRRAALAAALALMAAPALADAPPPPEDMAMGNPHAPVTVVEYASASCPHCARFNNEIFPAFKKKYVDTGKVRYVLKEFLTQPVEIAAAGFLLARCAGPTGYFPTLDRFFRAQNEIYTTGDAHGVIVRVGAQSGLSAEQVDACLSDQAALKALNDRVDKHAEQDKVDSTPTFDINGKRLADLDHEVTLADLDAAIQPLLKPHGRR
jgi:protein-disulfide isomerase